MEKEPTLSHVQ
ncbi:hypothetical protein SOVF_119510, partial [Spinacia oleracea]